MKGEKKAQSNKLLLDRIKKEKIFQSKQAPADQIFIARIMEDGVPPRNNQILWTDQIFIARITGRWGSSKKYQILWTEPRNPQAEPRAPCYGRKKV